MRRIIDSILNILMGLICLMVIILTFTLCNMIFRTPDKKLDGGIVHEKFTENYGCQIRYYVIVEKDGYVHEAEITAGDYINYKPKDIYHYKGGVFFG